MMRKLPFTIIALYFLLWTLPSIAPAIQPELLECPIILKSAHLKEKLHWYSLKREPHIATTHLVGGRKNTVDYLHTDRDFHGMIYGSHWSGPVYSRDSLDLEQFRGEPIFDAAAGPGAFVRELNDLGFMADGIDIQFLSTPLEHWPVNIDGADATHIPRPDRHYGVTMMTHGPYSYDNPQAMRLRWLSELARITKQTGIIKIAPVKLGSILSDLQHFPELELKYYRSQRAERLKRYVPTDMSFDHDLASESEIENYFFEVVIGFRGHPTKFKPRSI